MTKWRSSRRRPSLNQPALPGILDPVNRATIRRNPTHTELALERARLRLVIVLFTFVLIYGVIAGRLADLTLFNDTPEPLTLRAASAESLVVARADITDRNGTVLATSLPTVSLCADAPNILDPDEAAQKLLTVLPDLDRKRIDEELTGNKRCGMIKRHLTPKQYYEVNKLGIAGLEFRPDETRVYPAGHLTAHVSGFTDIDGNGIAGMEKSLNTRLEQNPQQSIALSIDLRLQTIMRRELEQAVKKFHALGAAGIIMDSRTGEILSLVSLPDYDPQHPGDVDDVAMFNRATLGVYEMGSTFKIFTMAAALDSGLIKPSDRFDTTHPLEAGRRVIRDFHPSKYPLNVPEIFMESSNIGAALMAERLGTQRQRAFLERLGLTEKLPLELPEVGAPIVSSPDNWSDITTMTVAFGHGIAVNAVQLTSAVASIVNDGIKVAPTLLKRAEPSGQKVQERLMSSKASAQIRALMRLVVTGGTAKSAAVNGYIVGGKTGTADKLSNGKYEKNARLASFIGVFPANAPRYLVFTMLDDPKGNANTYGFATGGWTAAPVVSRVISQMGPLLDLPPQDPDILAASERQMLRPLGASALASLNTDKETDDYASVESNRTQ